MRSAPSWLVERLRELSPTGPNLWRGPALAFPTDLRVEVAAPGPEAPRLGAPYAGVFVASVEGDLVEGLRSLREHCAPGALVALLLPEPGGGLRAALGAMFGPLGRTGRSPRARAEQCGALLAFGAVDIQVAGVAGRHSMVLGRLPAEASTLDAAFASRAPAST